MDESAEEHGRKSPEASRKGDSKSDVVISMPVPEMHSVGGVLAHMPQVHLIEKKKKKSIIVIIADKFDIVPIYTPTRHHTCL